MHAPDLLQRLAAVGLSVTATGDRLLIQPAAKLSDEMRTAIVSMKAELLALLGAAPVPPEVDEGVGAITESALPDRAAPSTTDQPTKASLSNEVSSASPSMGSKVAGSQRSHERMLERQRQRRATRARIDYYPSDEAMKALDAMKQRCMGAGANASSIIDRVLIDAGRASPDVDPGPMSKANGSLDGAKAGTQASTQAGTH